MTGHIKMFLNTEIMNVSVLSDIGNLFLQPIFFIASGKTVAITGKNTIAKVSTYYEGDKALQKHSKQKPELRSFAWGGPDDADSIIEIPLRFVFAIPCLIIGSIFKGLSFLDPKVRAAHVFVKEMLTPKNEFLGTNDKPLSAVHLEEKLRSALSSGQKIKSLVIYTIEPLNDACSRLIKQVNPFNTMLINEKTQGLAGILPSPNCAHNKVKSNWKFYLQEPKQNKTGQEQPSTVELAKKVFNANGPGFFEKKHKVFVLTPLEAISMLSPLRKPY